MTCATAPLPLITTGLPGYFASPACPRVIRELRPGSALSVMLRFLACRAVEDGICCPLQPVMPSATITHTVPPCALVWRRDRGSKKNSRRIILPAQWG
jgi:hypothetical protein